MLVELTQKDGRVVTINPAFVSCVLPVGQDGTQPGTILCMVGGAVPLNIAESYEDVLAIINPT